MGTDAPYLFLNNSTTNSERNQILFQNEIKINGNKIRRWKYTVTHTQNDCYEDSFSSEENGEEEHNATLEGILIKVMMYVDIKGCIDKLNVANHSIYNWLNL